MNWALLTPPELVNYAETEATTELERALLAALRDDDRGIDDMHEGIEQENDRLREERNDAQWECEQAEECIARIREAVEADGLADDERLTAIRKELEL